MHIISLDMAATKKQVAQEIFEHLGDITKEQYLEFCELYNELGLEMEENEPNWDEILSEFK